MNFLAHLFLAHDDEGLMVGNYIGDFVPNRELDRYPEALRRGVWLHRRIDTFTDNHPRVRDCLRLLRPAHGKYAGVVFDVLSDALLSHNWSAFHTEPLREFTRRVYAVLEAHLPQMPEALARRTPLMIADDWLMQYAREEGIAFTLSRLQHRASKPEFLAGGVESLRRHYVELNAAFMDFFPELMAEVATLRSGEKG
jgi:acyl carrier protein phosphodiesterase